MDELLKLMHDTMNCTATIKSATEMLRTNADLKPEEVEYLLKGISDRASRLNAVLDAYYLKKREEEKAMEKI